MTIPRTMKAAVVERFGEPLAVREVPVPEPGPGQALVKIMETGVCHTDLHAADGDWPAEPTLPFIPGHEGAGVVVALGPGVTHLKEGDRVGVAWLHRTCGHCEFCLSGWETLCPNRRTRDIPSTGVSRNTRWRRPIFSGGSQRTLGSWKQRPSCVPA